MKLRKTSLSIAAVVLTAVAASAQTQGPARRLYEPATETTVKGTVEQVIHPERGQLRGIHLQMNTGHETLEIALGPARYIETKGFSFSKGDTIEVTGSRVTIAGKEMVIAREVLKDGKTLTLRNKNGVPEWRGQGWWRRRT